MFGRPQLVSIVRTTLNVRDIWSDRRPEDEELLSAIQELSNRLLHRLGASNIHWSHLGSWEATEMRQLIQLVAGVPQLVSRIVDQMLLEVEQKAAAVHNTSREVGMQTGDEIELEEQA